jgi:hypothetical protein
MGKIAVTKIERNDFHCDSTRTPINNKEAAVQCATAPGARAAEGEYSTSGSVAAAGGEEAAETEGSDNGSRGERELEAGGEGERRSSTGSEKGGETARC